MLVGLQGEEIMKIIVGGCKIISEHKYNMITLVNSRDFKCPHNQNVRHCASIQCSHIQEIHTYTYTQCIILGSCNFFYCWLNQAFKKYLILLRRILRILYKWTFKSCSSHRSPLASAVECISMLLSNIVNKHSSLLNRCILNRKH